MTPRERFISALARGPLHSLTVAEMGLTRADKAWLARQVRIGAVRVETDWGYPTPKAIYHLPRSITT